MKKTKPKVDPNPTWYGTIRHYFTPDDIQHMWNVLQLNLGTYNGVRGSADVIHSIVAQGAMPPGKPWSQDMVQTFLNWMKNDYPKGVAIGVPQKKLKKAAATTRIRKEVRDLSEAEVLKLKTAFEGIMARDIDKELQSYFVLAGYHWLPQKPGLYCQHHVNKYLPWHRAYILSFENALRSVSGCEDVTLPYWDFEQKDFPDLFNQPPFNSYTFPYFVGVGFNKGDSMVRVDPSTIYPNYVKHVFPQLNLANTKTDWEDYNGFHPYSNTTIISAHDQGHNYVGGPNNPISMSNQDVAAFDPIFWFFHGNWDRLWWNWQISMNATTEKGFFSTIQDKVNLEQFTDPTQMNLPPFDIKTDQTINLLESLGVDYQDPIPKKGAAKLVSVMKKQPKLVGSTLAGNGAFVNTQLASVRVKGVNRIKIPGSFLVHLLKNGEPIAQSGFFQPSDPGTCENCVENSIVNFDFILPLKKVQGGKLSVVIEPHNKNIMGPRIPFKLVGNPTINVRLLLNTEE